MINNQLLDYIRQQTTAGVAKETIIANLKSQGWTDEDIAQAFNTTVTPLQSSQYVSGINTSIATAVVASNQFSWTDVAGNATSPYFGTTLVYNYPDYFSSTIKN